MKYFTHCTSLEDLKKEYRRLTMLHHPDRGGDTATMQEINNEHDELFKVLQHKHNTTHDEKHQSTETPEEFRNIVNVLLNLEGVSVELCGSWLWISGNTFAYKDTLKANGCRWSSTKKMWYWRHKEDSDYWSRGKKTIEQIRFKYGSTTFVQSEKPQPIPEAV
jgi:curved DNA-binding protein CbpA